ncbi:MAG TPA: hypothetical protein GX705_00615 [Clostridiales bacterium]|nr:hypothetical protein [Clostridiales bacterium]
MKKSKNYESLYRKNRNTGRVIIDIALEDYLEFFNEWDNSAFKKRDIHSELLQFLELCSEDIPLRKKLEFVFSLNSAEAIKEKEEQIRISFRNYFYSIQRLEKRKTNRFIRNSLVLLFIALMLLTLYGFMSRYTPSNILTKVLLESLLIGGWVFAWEAVHLLFIDIIEPLRRRRELDRFLDAEINFQYLKQ